MRTLKIEKSKTGIPCLWERGGGLTNTGDATIITNPDGTPPTAIYIPQRGNLACENHALIPIRKGMYVISANRQRENYDIRVGVITNITAVDVTLEQMASFSQGVWDVMPYAVYPAVEAAVAKARDYHCRSVYWAVAR